MRTAVVRLDLDPQRALSPEQLAAALRTLTGRGLVLHRQQERALELLLPSTDAEHARRQVLEACRQAGLTPEVETVSFISRGTDEDALGVASAFGAGATARLTRIEENGAEIAVLTIPATERRRIPESRLHTALEAALNCEVRLVFSS
jgi:predicted dinucleotide-binding enzyme